MSVRIIVVFPHLDGFEDSLNARRGIKDRLVVRLERSDFARVLQTFGNAEIAMGFHGGSVPSDLPEEDPDYLPPSVERKLRERCEALALYGTGKFRTLIADLLGTGECTLIGEGGLEQELKGAAEVVDCEAEKWRGQFDRLWNELWKEDLRRRERSEVWVQHWESMPKRLSVLGD